MFFATVRGWCGGSRTAHRYVFNQVSGAGMKARTMKLLVIGLAAIVCLFFVRELISLQQPSGLCLAIVGRTAEAGKPVVVFQVKGHAKRRMQITGVRQVMGTNREPVFLEPSNFAAPGWPCGNPSKAWREFAIFAPTNTSTWHIEARILFDHGTPIRRLRDFPSSWHSLRADMRMPRGKAAWLALGSFYGDSSDSYWIESQSITNSVPDI